MRQTGTLGAGHGSGLSRRYESWHAHVRLPLVHDINEHLWICLVSIILCYPIPVLGQPFCVSNLSFPHMLAPYKPFTQCRINFHFSQQVSWNLELVRRIAEHPKWMVCAYPSFMRNTYKSITMYWGNIKQKTSLLCMPSFFVLCMWVALAIKVPLLYKPHSTTFSKKTVLLVATSSVTVQSCTQASDRMYLAAHQQYSIDVDLENRMKENEAKMGSMQKNRSAPQASKLRGVHSADSVLLIHAKPTKFAVGKQYRHGRSFC